MHVEYAVRLVLLTAAMLSHSSLGGRSSSIRLCGRKLSDTVSRICSTYNSPWDDPAGKYFLELPSGMGRRKRDIGIADECCNNGCTWSQLKQYCAVTTNLAETLDPHMIADRSAEGSDVAYKVEISAPVAVATRRARGELGRGRKRGYGRGRGRRCRCRRKSRSSKRRASFMGNTGLVKNLVRAAPVVGTVSPLLTWGRSGPVDWNRRVHDRLAYVTV